MIESRKIECCLYKSYKDDNHVGIAFRFNDEIFISCDQIKLNFFQKLNFFNASTNKFKFSLKDNSKYMYKFDKSFAYFILSEQNKSALKEMFENFNSAEALDEKMSDREFDNNFMISFKLILFIYLSQSSIEYECSKCKNYLRSNNNIVFQLENLLEEFQKLKEIISLDINSNGSDTFYEKFKNILNQFNDKIENGQFEFFA